MNQQQPGNSGQGNQVQPPGNTGNGHPAWQQYLQDVPEALRPVVQQAFAKWDADVNTRMQEIHSQYEGLKQYQPLLDNNIPVNNVGLALQFADELQKNPKQMVERINQQMNLGFVPQEQVQRQAQQPVIDDPFGDPFNQPQQNMTPEQMLAENPLMKQMYDTLQAMQQRFDEQEQMSKAEEEAEQFEAYLEQLTTGTPLEGNENAQMLITAFMSQGKSGPEALQLVQSSFVSNLTQQTEQQLNGNQQNNVESPGNTELDPLAQAIHNSLQPVNNAPVGYEPQGNGAPVVMGNSGNAGSGVPGNPIDFGALKDDDVNSLVSQALAQVNQENA